MAKAKAPPEPLIAAEAKVLRGFKPGDIVFLECSRMLNDAQMEHLHSFFKSKVPELKIVILQAGVKVAAVGSDHAEV